MKRLVLVCGANGVGKSTACRELVAHLPGSAYIDSDYCRYMNPFSFTPEEIGIVVSNISTMMVNYFRLSTVDTVIFQYGIHGPRKGILDDILAVLEKNRIPYRYCPIILECTLEENIRRLESDRREAERIERAITNTRHLYDTYDYPRLDVTNLSPAQTAEQMLAILASEYPLK